MFNKGQKWIFSLLSSQKLFTLFSYSPELAKKKFQSYVWKYAQFDMGGGTQADMRKVEILPQTDFLGFEISSK